MSAAIARSLHDAPPAPPAPAAAASPDAGLGWARIVRLGLVQTAIGAVVVLMTSTLNRVLVVELGLPASVPGVLVALHFAVQLARARVGHATDGGARRSRWVVGGMLLLALSATAAAASVALVAERRAPGLLLTAVAFVGIGIGVSACGTALLATVAERVAPARRGRAVAILWIMMILGLAGTAGAAGTALDPFSLERLVAVCAVVCAVAVALTVIGMLGIDRGAATAPALVPARAARARGAFAAAFREVWADASTRRFATFVFVSMVAYSAQDLVLEPYAGLVFGMTPGESTRVGGLQHGGALLGMIAAAALSARAGMLRLLAVGGCLASGLALLGVALAGADGSVALLKGSVTALGVANGAFAVGALGCMVALTGDDRSGRAGLRLGVFGAAQAIAYATGGLLGAAVSDVARLGFRSAAAGYATVFVIEAACFACAAALALRAAPRATGAVLDADGDRLLAVAR